MKQLLLASLTFGASFLWAQCPPAAPVPAPISESFTSEAPGQLGSPTGTVLGNCWTMFGSGSSSFGYNWQTEDANGQNENSLNTGPHYDATTFGSSGGMYLYLETSSGTTGDTAFFLSPSIDISTLSSAELKFAYHMYGATMGDLAVQVNDGSGWVNVWSVSGQQQTAGNDPWLNAAVSLSGFASPITVRFAGVKGSSFTSDMSLDEIAIAVPPLCPNPSSLGAMAGSTSADVYWAAGDAAASSWEVEYGAPGFTQGAGTVSASTNDTLMLTGLSPITSYEFYVRETCVSVSGSSNWVGPYSFTTVCPPVFQAPYTEDFENALVGSFLDFGNCWTTPSTTTPRWESEDATGANENSPGTGPHYDNTTYGSAGGKYMFFEASGGSTGSTKNLVSPEIDISSLTAPYVEFYYHMFGGAMGTLHLDVWDATLGWSNGVATISGQQHAAGSDPWLKFGVAVPAGYDSIVQFRFRAVRSAGFRSDMAVDDFSVMETPLCPSPFGISASNIMPFSADINFTGTGNSYNIEWGITGFPQGSGTIVNDTTNPIMLNGLPDNSTLDVYVQIDCDSNGVSTWEGPITFSTPAACPAPTNGQSFNVTGNSADITWSSSGIITGFTVEYGPAGFSQGSGTVINTPNDTLSLTGLSGLTSYDVYIRQDCDTNGTSLWGGPFNFTTACGIFSAPYFEDFETATLGANTDFGNCWVMQNTTAPNWEGEDATGSNENSFNTGPFYDNTLFGTPGGTYMYLETSGGATGASKNLRSGDIDVSTLTTPYVEFFYHMYGANMGTLALDVRDPVLGWTNDIVILTGQQQTAGADPWQKIGAVLPAGYDSIVRFRFRGIKGTGFTSDMSVDDFSVIEAPACPDVSSLAANLFQGGTAAQISWNGQGGSSFNIEYGPAGFGQGSGTVLNLNVDSVLLTGLTPVTSYDVYVQNDCSSNGAGTSNWVGPFTFTTACGVSMAPYFEDFEGVTPGRALDYGNCWTIPNTTTPAWEAEDASGANENSLNTGPHFDNTTPGVAGGMYMYLETSGGFGNTGEITSADVGVNLLTSPYVEFYYHMYGATMGTMAVDVFDQTLGWTNDIISITGQQQTAGNDPWLKVGAVLPAGYDSIVRFRIRGTSTTSFTSDMAIDDFSVIEAPLCPDVTSIIAGLIQGFSAEILWNGQGGSNFNIEYGPQGFGQGSGTVLTSTVDSILITGLTPVTSYDVYIQNDCSTSGNGTSNWVGPFTFTTTVTCPAPTNVQVAQSTTSAAFAWTPAGAPYQNYVFGPAGTTPATGTIQTTQNDTVSVSGLSPSTPYTFWVRDSCGVGDVSTWVGPLDFNTLCVAAPIPYLRDFDGTNWPPLCWDLTGGTQTVLQNSSDYMEGNYWSWSSGQFALATTEPITISSDARVKYRWAHQFNTSYPNDQLIVMVRLANSTAWDTLVNHIGPSFNSPNTSPTVPPSDADFIQEAVNLDPSVYTGNDVIFRMVFNSGFGPDVYVDDFIVEALPSCPEPTSVTAVTVNAYDATLSWSNGSATANQWYIEYGVAGFAPGTGTIVPATTNPFTLTGLNAATTYEAYVTELCPNGVDTSGYFAPVLFSTLCAPITAPYSQNFTGTAPGQSGANPPLTLGNCWELGRDPGSGPGWETEDASGVNENSFNTGPHFDNTTFGSAGGMYVYLETSTGATTGPSYFTSPIIVTSALSIPNLRFYYHMYGATMDSLRVDVYDLATSSWTNGVWSMFGQQQTAGNDPWIEANVGLSAYSDSIRVRFMGKRGSSFTGDMSLDDISIDEAPACPNPASLGVAATTAYDATLYWTAGGVGASNWYIQYGAPGFAIGSGTIVPVSNDTATISGLTPSTNYEYYVAELCPNGVDTSNFVGPISFQTLCVPASIPYLRDFDGANWPPLCWNISGTTQMISQVSSDYLAASFWSNNNAVATTTTEPITISVDARVKFRWAHLFNSAYPLDQLVLRMRLASGTTWDTLANLVGPTFNSTNAQTTLPPTGGDADFVQETFNLNTSYTGQDVVFELVFQSDFGPWVYVDDFIVEPLPACPEPTTVTASAITATTADLSWTNGNAAASTWYIEYGPIGFPLGSGTVVTANSNPYTLTGLNSSTAYTAYVLELCQNGLDTSAYSTPVSFSTACTTAGLPYNTGFTGVNPGITGSIPLTPLSNCWEIGGANVPRWETEDASGANENSLNTGPFYDATTPGVAGGMYLYLETSGGGLGDTAAAKMTPVDLGGGNTDLEFYYHMFGAAMGNLYVQINDGSGWTTLDTLAGQQQTAGSDSFLLRVVPLTGYTGTVSIKFLGQRGSSFTSDMAIDEISVVTNGNPNCPTPQLVSDSTYCTSAVMAWVSTSGSSFCEYGPAGFAPGTGILVNNAVSPLVVSGLNLNTAYDYYVYDVCNGGTDTSFAAIGTLTTNAGPVAAFNFSVNLGTVSFDGSSSSGTNSWSWDFGDGNNGTGSMPTHTFLSNGSYNVTLVVTDSTCGISDTLVQVVSITNVATCPQPSGLFTGAVECDSAVISWTSISGASLIEYGPAGFTPGTGNQLAATSPFVLSGLNAGQSYEYWIADVCAATSDTSGFSGPVAFATPTAPDPTVNASFVLSSVTLTQATVDFDASNSLNASSYTWDFGNATGGTGPTPTATYLQNGTYFVQLTVANGCGTADTIIEVTVAGISVNEDELASSLNIFPNPTKDVVNVVIENPSTNDYSVELIDALGQLIEEQSVQDARGRTELRFDMSSRAQGVYLLRVRTGKATITRRITRY